MTQEISRLDRAFAALDALDQPEPQSDRISAAMKKFRGFDLTGASDTVRDAIESVRIKYDAIAQRYSTQSPEASPEFSDDDARELVSDLRQAAELIRDAETERIMTRLRSHNYLLPEAEIIEARRHQAWFIKHLMRGCRELIAVLKERDNVKDLLPEDLQSTTPFFALYLFSEWDVAESVPIVLEGVKLPGEGPFELFGDAIHDQLPRYLAQFLLDDPDQIDALIRDSQVDLYVRWAAAGSYQYLVRDQKVSFDDAVAHLDRLFEETKIKDADGFPDEGHPYELSSGILDSINSIGGSSRSAVLADERNWDFVDEFIISRKEIFELPESADAGEVTNLLRKLPPTRIEDCFEELRGWGLFEPTSKHGEQPPKTKPRERPKPVISRPPNQPLSAAAQKPAARAERVPRNAPCPCGSGKKYKQCCLRKET